MNVRQIIAEIEKIDIEHNEQMDRYHDHFRSAIRSELLLGNQELIEAIKTANISALYVLSSVVYSAQQKGNPDLIELWEHLEKRAKTEHYTP
jgi:predicted molibdopterin-dependent oxidoreductase YjgC